MSRKLEVIFSASTGQLERAFNKVARDSERLGKSGQTAGQHFSNFSKVAMIAGGVMGGVFLAGMHKATEAAITNEAAQAKLGAQLRTVGKDNEDVRGRIDRTVESLSRMSGFKGVELTGAFTALVRTTGNVTKSQKELALATDIARGRGISLAQASTLLNRVNVGSIGGLKRVGIEVNKNTTKEQALALLRQKFGGQAAAYANSAAGAQARLSAATEAAWEKMGTALTPVVIAFANFASSVLPRVISIVDANKGVFIALAGAAGVLWAAFTASKVINTTATAFRTLNVVMEANPFIRVATAVILIGTALYTAYHNSETFRNAVDTGWMAIKTTVMNVVNAVVGFIRANWPQISAIVMPIINQVKNMVVTSFNVIKGVIQFVTNLLHGNFAGAWTALKGIATAVLNGIVQSIVNLGTSLLNAAKGLASAALQLGVKLAKYIVDGMAQIPSLIKNKISQAFGLAGDPGAVNPYMPAITGHGKRVANAVGLGITGSADKIKGPLGNVVTQAANQVASSAPAKTQGIGSGMTGGITQGIKNNPGGVQNALTGVIDSAINAQKRRLGIHSPSTVMAELLGKPMAQGIAVGFHAQMDVVGDSVSASVAQVVHNARSSLQGLGSTLASNAHTYFSNKYVDPATGKTPAQMAKDHQKVLDDRHKADLQAAVDNAKTNDEKARAQQELDDFVTEQQITNAQNAADAAGQAGEDAVNNWVAQFNSGQIDLTTFQTNISNLVGGPAGEDQGTAFGLSFATSFSDVIGQSDLLKNFPTILGGTSGVQSTDTPTSTAIEGGDAVPGMTKAQWNQALANYKKAIGKSHPSWYDKKDKNKLTPAGSRAFDRMVQDWKAANPMPAMAAGGVVFGATAALIGEAGPEAVLPLSNHKAGKMLAGAMADAGIAGGTTVVVNVAGNEFSAADFARKLQPELARLISRRY